MKLLILCGSIEPAKNGVGDYCRRLAGALIEKGHEVMIVSLFDDYVKSYIENNQSIGISQVVAKRIPATITWKERIHLAKSVIHSFSPEVISLQLVLHAFDKKGLPFNLGGHIQQITQGCSAHIMFHELWAGINPDASIKLKFLKFLQIRIIKSLLHKTKPVVLHTHSPLYQLKLQEIGVDCRLLPLFGNVPVVSNTNKEDTSVLEVVLFGTVKYSAVVGVFIKELKVFALDNNKQLKIIFVGRNGNQLEGWLSEVKKQQCEFIVMGELSLHEISKVLSHADMGVSTTRYELSSKSGAAAAMLEHGLPVISVASDFSRKLDVRDVEIKGVLKFHPDFKFDAVTKKNNELGYFKNIIEQFCNAVLSS